MQPHIILTLMAAAAVSAHPLETRASLQLRQADAIKSALMPVMQSLKELDTAINGLTTDPATAAPILTASMSASSTLKEAATQINAADDVSLFSAIGLQQTGTDLADQVGTTIGDLMNKKPVLDQLGVTSVAVQSLQQQKAASGGLSSALLSKVPAIAKPIAQQSTDKIGKTLDDGIAALSAPAAAAPAAAAPPAAADPPAAAAPPAEAGAAPTTTPTEAGAEPATGAGSAPQASGSAAAAAARRRRS